MYYTSMLSTLKYIILHKHATYFEIYLDMMVTIKFLSNDVSSVNNYKKYENVTDKYMCTIFKIQSS